MAGQNSNSQLVRVFIPDVNAQVTLPLMRMMLKLDRSCLHEINSRTLEMHGAGRHRNSLDCQASDPGQDLPG